MVSHGGRTTVLLQEEEGLERRGAGGLTMTRDRAELEGRTMTATQGEEQEACRTTNRRRGRGVIPVAEDGEDEGEEEGGTTIASGRGTTAPLVAGEEEATTVVQSETRTPVTTRPVVLSNRCLLLATPFLPLPTPRNRPPPP